MPVKVKCPSCEKVLSVPDAARGKAVKCPQCESRIAVPREEDKGDSSVRTSRSAAAKSKVKKPAKALDSEAALATFDMRRAEDTEARICSKCGFDMQYQDEDDNECPQCGYDSSAGGLGAKARKKQLKGPDPADFYPGLVKEAWKFVGKNQLLAWRTVMYTLVCLWIALGCAFMYLWVSMWPPRMFLALCFTVSFLVIPGWMWFLDTEVIKLTLERKDKFKKLNFDFFLASAMGAAFVFWCLVVLIPVLAIPAGIGYALVNYSGMPDYVMAVCLGLGAIPAIWMLPVVMSHMTMPVQYKGWMVWKVIPMCARNIAPLSFWMLWFLITNVVNIGGVVAISTVYGQEIASLVRTMEFNADVRRQEFARIQNPNTKKKGEVAPTLEKLPDLQPVNFQPLIIPAVILSLMSVVNGFTSMFNMRTNGQFTYYHKNSLELIDKLKEYKYKAKEKVDEDEDEKPKTAVQHLVDAAVLNLVFCLLGLVGGMLYGSLTEAGVPKGIMTGLWMGVSFAGIAVWINFVKEGFADSPVWGILNLLFHPISGLIFVSKNWEYRQGLFFQWLVNLLVYIPVFIGAIAFEAVAIMKSGDAGSSGAAPQMMQPGQMMPPRQMMPPGQMGPGGMPGPMPGGPAAGQ
ncbi:hypothetical protein [Schlesneria sp. DSM 10557]|uniref:hypothetical protein n=1 Tax=Schlesneria sp. DSM 10557 TaxID=3044399 RepID=UPI0035A0FF86